MPEAKRGYAARLAEIRERGLSRVQGDLLPGVASVAAPVFGHDGAIVALTNATLRLHRTGAAPRGLENVTQGRTDLGQFTGEPVTQRLENASTAPMRAIAVENLREGKWTTPPALTAPGTSLRQENRSFAVYDMRLNAGAARTVHTHQNPSFIFLMSGVVQVQGGGGESEFRLEQGRTWWFPSSGPDQPHTIELVGTADAHVICVEAK